MFFENLMASIDSVINSINDALYSYVLIAVLLLGGLYFTVRGKFAQIRMLPEQVRVIGEKPAGKGGVSSFQALMVSTASRVGTGNIIGVSTAICMGGFGAVFWMWVIAIVGAGSAFVESTLAQIYKKRGPDGCYGGPAYYIETALKCRPLAIVFSILLILTYGIGFNMLASYNLQSTFAAYDFYNATTFMPWIIGGVLALLVAYCLFGGGKRVLKVTSVLVPIMGIVYILVALVIVALNITSLPGVFGRIFSEAFDFRAIFGGIGGSCLMYGIKRGLFSNEAGVGSAPNASAAADVSHPVKQGLVQTLSVFIDTIVICSATGFMCMTSGVEAGAAVSGAAYVQSSLAATLGSFGPVFITLAMVLFAFTTLLGNLYYVDQCVFYVVGFVPPKWVQHIYHGVGALVVLLGAGLSADFLWNFSDVTMGVMTLINIPVCVALSGIAIRALRDFESQKKKRLNPHFVARDIGLDESELSFWK